MIKKLFYFFILAFSSVQIAFTQASNEANASLKIKLDSYGASISPNLYGIFFEDINNAGDGGIYAEMLRNRSFEDIRPPEGCRMEGDMAVTPGNFKWYSGVSDSVSSWKLIKTSNAEASMHLDTSNRFNKAQLYALRVDVTNGQAYICNEGYFGISIKKGENYKLSFYAHATETVNAKLEISLEDEKGIKYAQAEIGGLEKNWKKFQATLNASETNHKLKLVISIKNKGSVWFDIISLFPEKTFNNRENGLRADLMEQLKAMHPKFLRFPGGCVVEGITFEEAIRWKETIGDVAERPGRVNVWGYRSTDGLGFLEFLQMAEDLGCDPLFVINIGMTCQARNSYSMPMNQLQPMIQDALDAIEYANGPASSKWGAVRAKHGHPEPFKLRYFEIGNENWGLDYDERYLAFYNAIKEKYPEIIIIRSAHPTADKNPLVFPENKGDILDLHYYRSPDWLFKNHHILDDYPRIGKKIYIGEFACNEKVGRGNLLSALADATFMMSFERNADIIELASYAPLFENEDKEGYKWPVNMIHYNNHQIYAIPTYFVHQMFAQYKGNVVLPTEFKSDTVSVPVNNSLQGGAIGFDTYSTESEFDNVLVTKGKDTLLFEDFSNTSTRYPLQKLEGHWKIENGVLHQTDATLFAHAVMGDTSWHDYTVTFNARKIRGNEGFFMSAFQKNEQNCLKWNIGGWNNTQHALEIRTGGSSSYPVPMIPGKIRENEWYKVQMTVNGRDISCKLNDTLIHKLHLSDKELYQRIFTVVTKDTNKNAVIVKMVNPFPYAAKIDINLEGTLNVNPKAEEIVLTSESLNDNNSFENPLKVSPKKSSIKLPGKSFTYELKPGSLTFLVLSIE